MPLACGGGTPIGRRSCPLLCQRASYNENLKRARGGRGQEAAGHGSQLRTAQTPRVTSPQPASWILPDLEQGSKFSGSRTGYTGATRPGKTCLTPKHEQWNIITHLTNGSNALIDTDHDAPDEWVRRTHRHSAHTSKVACRCTRNSSTVGSHAALVALGATPPGGAYGAESVEPPHWGRPLSRLSPSKLLSCAGRHRTNCRGSRLYTQLSSARIPRKRLAAGRRTRTSNR